MTFTKNVPHLADLKIDQDSVVPGTQFIQFLDIVYLKSLHLAFKLIP